jgi:hypothetical protein
MENYFENIICPAVTTDEAEFNGEQVS